MDKITRIPLTNGELIPTNWRILAFLEKLLPTPKCSIHHAKYLQSIEIKAQKTAHPLIPSSSCPAANIRMPVVIKTGAYDIADELYSVYKPL